MTRQRNDRADMVVDAIREFSSQHGYPPSVRDLVALTGLASTGAVQYHLDGLVAEGRVARDPHINRSLRVIDEAA